MGLLHTSRVYDNIPEAPHRNKSEPRHLPRTCFVAGSTADGRFMCASHLASPGRDGNEDQNVVFSVSAYFFFILIIVCLFSLFRMFLYTFSPLLFQLKRSRYIQKCAILCRWLLTLLLSLMFFISKLCSDTCGPNVPATVRNNVNTSQCLLFHTDQHRKTNMSQAGKQVSLSHLVPDRGHLAFVSPGLLSWLAGTPNWNEPLLIYQSFPDCDKPKCLPWNHSTVNKLCATMMAFSRTTTWRLCTVQTAFKLQSAPW